MSAGDTTTFRPRNGVSAECYWRIRAWCEEHGFSLSDVFNAILIPLAYYLENHCKIDRERNMAMVTLNVGNLPILHVVNGKMYPLASQKGGDKVVVTLKEMKEKVAYWEKLNEETPTEYDRILKDA